MEKHFEKEAFHAYLVLPVFVEKKDTYINQLLQFHHVPCFMKYEFRQCDGKEELYYELKYRTTVKSVFFNLQLSLMMMKNFINSIIKALEVAEEFLLNVEDIVWESDCIFIEANTGNLEFCYLPQKAEGPNLKEFLLEIIQGMDKKQEESMMLMLQFYNLVTEEDCSLERLVKFRKEQGLDKNCIRDEINRGQEDKEEKLDDIKEKKEEDVSYGEQIVKILLLLVTGINLILIICLLFQVFTYDKMVYLFIGLGTLIVLIIIYMFITKEDSADEMMESYFQGEGNNVQGEDEENQNKEEEILRKERSIKKVEDDEKDGDKIEETVLLVEGMEKEWDEEIVQEDEWKQLYLVPMKKEKYKEIMIEKKSIVIGSMKKNTDYQLVERGISRMHAKIMKKDDGIFLLDLNSTNGTFVNGENIKSGEEYRLESGDLVMFGKVEFFVANK